jgi:hypothetical protein
MVEWYNPRELIRIAIPVLISKYSGQGRFMEEAARDPNYYDYSDGKDFWLDYLADTGDGWNPTYAIASLVAQPELPVFDRKLGQERLLTRGYVLVFGGDEVYPAPSRRAYEERLVGPFETAFPKPDTDPPPDLFAIPGNHDWYDGLVAFSRRFTQLRSIGGWATRQGQSYFALRLPHGWWLWAVDVLPGVDIDYGQREYFCRVAEGRSPRGPGLKPGDRIILASPKPDWIYGDIREPLTESNLGFFEDLAKRHDAGVYLWLAGDFHHYRRHEHVRDTRFQRITSGGGGAFLHPTHRPARRTVVVGEDEFVLKAAFPEQVASFRLSLLNALFLIKNWKFGILTGIAYAAFTWTPLRVWGDLLTETFVRPWNLMWIAIILACFMLFYPYDERPWFRVGGGLVHACAHLAAAFLIAWLTLDRLGGAVWIRLILNFLGGAIAGPIILGFYLLLALNLFGAHAGQAFSSLRIQDFKHFLRLHVTEEGDLEIFAIGIRRVPRGDEAHATYELIEPPITIKP